MSLAMTEVHCALAAVAETVVASCGGVAKAREILLDDKLGRWWEHDELWKTMLATGWLGLHIEEQFGGQGYGLTELSIVLEQIGRAAIGGPFLPTAAVSAIIAEVGTKAQRRRWLPDLVSGKTIGAIAAASDARVADSAVSATAVPALGEVDADIFLLPVDGDLLLVEAGAALSAARIDSVDRLMRSIALADLSEAPVVDVFIGAAPTARRILLLIAAAEAVGGLSACTEMAVSYAAAREQFGRPIGAFQAIKHRCANMLVDTELAVAATWDAARTSGGDAGVTAAMAAAHTLIAYQRAALDNVQVHGGIGYTWEHDAHLYIRRATVLNSFVGGQDTLRDNVFELCQNGLRRAPTVDLPEDAERFRQSALQFRAKLATTDPGQRQKVWARSGYLQPHWPKPYGREAGSVEQLIIADVLDGLEAPTLGLGEWVVPTLLQHGTAEQKERLLWPSLEGELRWCQLFSEPGAGSDAAAVATKAQRAEGGWTVNGQKVWTSDALICQRGLATVRTDPNAPKHQGITAMIIDLSSPGVNIRPLTEITGETLFNEVFFDDVFVPDRDVVGVVNEGWKVAMATLGNERVFIGSGSSAMTADMLIDLMTRFRAGDEGLARDVGALLTESYALTAMNVRQAARAVLNAGPGIEGNIAKLFGAEHAQRVAELGMRVANRAVITGGEPGVVHDYLYTRCLTIAGGTSEILRNVVAERILGLPRDPAPA